MNIKYCSDYNEMSQMACDSIVSGLKEKSRQLICKATGHSPAGTYDKLAEVYKIQPDIFRELAIVKLDEWGGIEPADASSCETYIQKKIIQPIQIPKERYISFRGNSVSPKKECSRIQLELKQKGPIELCVLGLGQNGHIGFNEPSNSLIPHCHVAKLSTDSLNHQMIKDLDFKPTYGMTLGMADILQSKKIILLVTGSEKKKVIKKLLSKEITTELPASFLWLHKQVACYIDSTSV